MVIPTLFFLGACSQTKNNETQSLPESTKTIESNPQNNVLATTAIAEKSDTKSETPAGTRVDLLYGKWKPTTYIDANGTATDLTALPDAQKASLSWEFTPEGTVKLGEIEGTFEVEGNQIIARNESSGNEKRFEFSVSEIELTIVSDDSATLKLARE